MPSVPSTFGQSGKKEIIAIGSDHGGFALKEVLKPFVESLSYKVVDLGTYSEEACDYPDFAYAVARTVSLGEASKGIMIDAVGLASAIVANKLLGIRAACCFDEFSARSSREHNDANVLTLGGRVLGTELAKAIVKAWLETSFGGGRHQKRIEKITQIENREIHQNPEK
ncbi:MAG: ribose 5-phosphate isomerase B [Ignavibacteriae bacterium]|nr:ribose 5-phosphate isomerase B [Ignavibacteria bacterium]MBI3364026.1 ribose 5-phosphate isomerase B [Ignavibacteriota bacterium]